MDRTSKLWCLIGTTMLALGCGAEERGSTTSLGSGGFTPPGAPPGAGPTAMPGQDPPASGQPPAAGGDGGTSQPPAGEEVCNGFDDDGDGLVDEGGTLCPCEVGEQRECFPGADTVQIGGASICSFGMQQCMGTAEFGSWGPCEGAVVPVSELCGDGVDQDCDGRDEPCEEVPDPEPEPVCDQFTIGEFTRPVDIVWVIDTSGSMSEEIDIVRENMNAFADRVSGESIDYRVVVVGERGTSEHEICIDPPLASSGCRDGQRFQHIDAEVGSHNAPQVLTSPFNLLRIQLFLRENSARHVVIVSDDNCSSCAALDGLRRTSGWEDYRLHSVVDTGPGSTDCGADIGRGYTTRSGRMDGLTFDICRSSWDGLYDQLVESVVDSTKLFSLSQTPIDGSLEVSINGTTSSAWNYDRVRNQLVLQQALGDGTPVEACYLVAP